MAKRRKLGSTIRGMPYLLFLLLVSGIGFAADDGAGEMKIFNFDKLVRQNGETDLPYLEFLRVESMSAYIYELSAGADDEQEPHDQDEIYYVVAGEADFTAGIETKAISAGDILYVKKYAVHFFSNIRSDLKLLVVFAPPDSE